MPWGKGNPRWCAQIFGYPQAVRHFARRGPVKSIRWQKNERPLVGTTENWFKVVQGPNEDYYDLFCLNDTPTIRYWRPEEDGRHTVWLSERRYGYHSANFLSRMGWHWHTDYKCVGGGTVRVPLNPHVEESEGLVPAGWSAVLTFNKDDELILSQSDHRTIYLRKSDTEDKAVRKRVLGAMQSTLDVLMLHLPTFHADSRYGYQRGKTFGGFQQDGTREEVAKHIQDLAGGAPLTDDILKALLPYCQEVYNVSLSKRLYAESHEDPTVLPPAQPGAPQSRWMHDIPAHMCAPVPEATYHRSLRSALLRHSGLMRQHGNVALPKFAASLPKRYFYAPTKRV